MANLILYCLKQFMKVGLSCKVLINFLRMEIYNDEKRSNGLWAEYIADMQ